MADKRGRSTYEQLKYVPINETHSDWHVSFGGQARTQFSALKNDRFELLGDGDGTLWRNRLTLHSDWHFGPHARIFVELGTHHAETTDDIEPGPFDEDEANVQQAFVDLTQGAFTMRLGRQESPFGSARLVSVRDGSNVRRAFDGGKLIANGGDVQASAFYLREVRIEKGVFDDERNNDEELWGLYTTWDHLVGPTHMDAYYFGTDRANEQYVQGEGRDERHSLGLRLFGGAGAWDWNYEFVYQFGDFATYDVQAWTVATITGYRFADVPWSPRVKLSANIASGDDDPNDDELNTFNPLYPNLFYFEEAAILAPQNFMNLHPGVSLSPRPDVTVSLDWNFFWKLRKEDGVYTRGLFPLPGTADSRSRFVAHVPQLSVDWEISPYISVDLRYNHFFVGDAIEDAGGDDVDFFMAEVTFNF